jgi:hypothetical protein
MLCLAASNFAYHFFDDGLANTFGLETLRHGTNPVNYLGIIAAGGQPAQGGTLTGSTNGFHDDQITGKTKGYFYIFKDSELQNWLAKRLLPYMHSFLSGYNFTANILYLNDYESDSMVVTTFRVFFGTIGGMFSLVVTPVLKFRFSNIDHTRLTDDPSYGGMAYRTKQAVENWRIGLIGTLISGASYGWYERIQANPGKILTGVIQLTVGVALAILIANTLVASQALITPVAVGALLAY